MSTLHNGNYGYDIPRNMADNAIQTGLNILINMDNVDLFLEEPLLYVLQVYLISRALFKTVPTCYKGSVIPFSARRQFSFPGNNFTPSKSGGVRSLSN